jgi:8-oxo-dGTP pyrophosphatase MutT (NUDIX family)
MPRSFPDMQSLKYAAGAHGFRPCGPDESESSYRAALADHVQSRDLVESMEIRTGKGWNAFSEIESVEMLARAFNRQITEEEKAPMTKVNVTKSENLEYSRTATGAVVISHDRQKVMLVTSTKFPGLWVLPKGGLEPDLTPEENAKKETREEAGIEIFLHEKIYDEVLSYPATDDKPAKIQREIYFRAEFGSYTEWEEFQLRKRDWFAIDAGLRDLMTDQQYEVVQLALVAAKVADLSELGA